MPRADLGHGGTGALPGRHQLLLPGRPRRHPRLRRHPDPYLRQHPLSPVPGHQVHGRRPADDHGGQQVRPGGAEDCAVRGGGPLRRGLRHAAGGDQRPHPHQHRAGVRQTHLADPGAEAAGGGEGSGWWGWGVRGGGGRRDQAAWQRGDAGEDCGQVLLLMTRENV